jgi:hypothetical protein
MVDLRGRRKGLVKLGREMEVKVKVFLRWSARRVRIGRVGKGRCSGNHQKR